LRRDSGVDHGSEEHVAADAGKTLKVGYAHKVQIFTTEGTGIAEEGSLRPLCPLWWRV
jgi:hypothetical protein